MKTIWHMALEPVESRYTAQWLEVIPRELKKRGVNVVTLLGDTMDASTPTQGAFLNFTATNVWKNQQTNKLANAFASGEVKDGDFIFWPDAWHSGILQAKYMSELIGVNVEMGSYFHAGSYDPQDFLGRKIKDKTWSFNAERSFFYACDYNFFATQFHVGLMTSALGIDSTHPSIIRTGQPHYKLLEDLYVGEKRDLILFPHRVAPEKQIAIFLDLKKSLPQYEWVVCQEVCKSKEDYHKLLAESKMIFSANLQETLGISAMEAVMSDSVPLVPDRLSYSEMYEKEFLYPSEWTESSLSYMTHKAKIMDTIGYVMSNHESYLPALDTQKPRLVENYLTSEPMFNIMCIRK